TGRMVGLAAAVAAPLLAGYALGRQAVLIRRLRAELSVTRPSIHDVPALPPMWRHASDRGGDAARFRPQSAATVPPEYPHSPPAPPLGVTVRPTVRSPRRS